MKIVVKLGTSVLTAGTGQLHRPTLVEVARQVSQLRRDGHQIVLVSSAAISAGRQRLSGSIPKPPNGISESLAHKQVLAAVGQVHLMSAWQQALDVYDLTIGQMLLTRADLDDRERYLNARDTMEGLLAAGVLPIINENDAVATTEIKVGDNDNLSASVAVLAAADLLILLTDQPGLMTANPQTDPDARLIRCVDVIDDHIVQLAGGSGTSLGTGGMITKLQAANTARRSGIDVAIAGIKSTDFLLRVVSQEGDFTSFPKSASRLESRKRWILAGPPCSGQLILDPGACDAVTSHQKSLLAKGIVDVKGVFHRGDVITMINSEGRQLAKGIVRYGSQDLKRICGLHSDQIHSELGYHLGDAVVHRDELVLI